MFALSVVVPTYNRRDRLARVLLALERQTTRSDRFEVVVVDDGSSDGTAEWLASQNRPYALQTLRQENGGPARARNAGVHAARGAIVLFIDDDVEPSESLVEEHLRCQEAEPNVVVVGPLASLPHYAQPWVAWEQAKVEAQYEAMTRRDWPPTFRQFWTGNASVAKEHLLAAGLFDPGYLRAEDVELGLRLMRLGLQFRFNPRARGLHYAERSLAAWEVAHSSYGRNEVAIFGKLGEDALIELLSDNWQRLNPATRWVVTQCIGRPRRDAALRSLLRGHLRVAERFPIPFVTQHACSLLASLLYWQASSETLGPQRSARVLGKSGAYARPV